MSSIENTNFTRFTWFIYICQTLYIAKLFVDLHIYAKNILFFFEILLYLMAIIQIFAVIMMFFLYKEIPNSKIDLELIKKYVDKYNKNPISPLGYFNTFMHSVSFIAALAIKDYSMIFIQGTVLLLYVWILKLGIKYWREYFQMAKNKFPDHFDLRD